MHDGFEAFWRSYPRRVAKLDALKAWKQLNPPIEDVLTALTWQREQWHDLTYVPYPASWLRAGRWMDERPDPSVKAHRGFLTRDDYQSMAEDIKERERLAEAAKARG